MATGQTRPKEVLYQAIWRYKGGNLYHNQQNHLFYNFSQLAQYPSLNETSDWRNTCRASCHVQYLCKTHTFLLGLLGYHTDALVCTDPCCYVLQQITSTSLIRWLTFDKIPHLCSVSPRRKRKQQPQHHCLLNDFNIFNCEFYLLLCPVPYYCANINQFFDPELK